MQRDLPGNKWKKHVLIAAGIYNLLWGAINILFPNLLFYQFGIEPLNYPQIWQTVGMIVGVYGIGYIIAAGNPNRHWPIILVGFLGKVFGITGYLYSVTFTDFPAGFGITILFNDLVWIIPFGIILKQAYDKTFEQDAYLLELFSDHDGIKLDMFETSEDLDLNEMSYKWPTMLVFLRHFGCTFCRETLEDISRKRNNIEIMGTRIVVVHMSDDHVAHNELKKYNLEDLPQISDPECILYKMFRLRKGNLMQLLGLKVLFRGFVAGVLKGHGIGKEMGDVSQMPGVFMLHKGKILDKYIHKTAADRPDYSEFARCCA